MQLKIIIPSRLSKTLITNGLNCCKKNFSSNLGELSFDDQAMLTILRTRFSFLALDLVKTYFESCKLSFNDKMITSLCVVSGAQTKEFLISQKNHFPFFRGSFLYFLPFHKLQKLLLHDEYKHKLHKELYLLIHIIRRGRAFWRLFIFFIFYIITKDN